MLIITIQKGGQNPSREVKETPIFEENNNTVGSWKKTLRNSRKVLVARRGGFWGLKKKVVRP